MSFHAEIGIEDIIRAREFESESGAPRIFRRFMRPSCRVLHRGLCCESRER
jgi:hypothetical protein